MSLLKQINRKVVLEETIAVAAACVLVENCKNRGIAALELVESAEEFLGQLAVNIQHGKISKDVNDNTLRNNMAMLTALDLLRSAQGRKSVNVNSVKGWLQIVDGVSRNLENNGIDVKLINDLQQMVDDNNRQGMTVRDEYIKMAGSPDINPLVQKIKQLETAYRQIKPELQRMLNKTTQPNNQPNTQTNNQPNAQTMPNGAVPQPAV